MRSALEAGVSAAALALGATQIPDSRLRDAVLLAIAVLFVLALVLELPVLNRIKIAHTSYSVSTDFVYIARGRWIRRTVMMPTARILNVESVQGPLLRPFGLVTVKFTCLSDVEALGPLTPSRADGIRRLVLDGSKDAARV